ncbi:hypothetical protein DAEQUDRAFT_770616 [Daedalea quercina L-15889]|uniref:Uncharacterized protein n=1 Tax=Daedalea quercina L-15889 TaxID=1314783 RepID=A0A165KQ49_9APHY|nr:hypothetical protein DAEQUDRAFT_770616 [Daedalea quercina L-15889]
MNYYPTDLTPVYFRMKRIALENVTRWFVVHGGRVDGAYYDLQRATEQSLHTGTALVTSYTSLPWSELELHCKNEVTIPLDRSLRTPLPVLELHLLNAPRP